MNERLELDLFDDPLPKPKPKPKRRRRVKPKPPPPKPRVQEWEWRVVYRRRGWEDKQRRVVRYFQTTWGLKQFVAKLRQPSSEWDDLTPIVELYVQRRRVSEWEAVPTRGGRPIGDYQGRKR